MASLPADPRVTALLGEAERAARAGRANDAAALHAQVLEIAPGTATSLNALGNRALSAGDPLAARDLFERATRADPGASPLWLNLAFARRAAGDPAGELDALEGALVADPYYVIALLEKARWFERHGRADEAVRGYRALIAAAPPEDALSPAFREALRHGRELIEQADDRLRVRIEAALPESAAASERIAHAVDVLTGRRKVYVHQPAGLHVPYLPAIQFFDRALFPWFAALEAATAEIRAEFLAQAADGDRPYIRIAPGQPVNQWQALNHSLEWGARFLWHDGREAPEAQARYPRTTALLRTLPLLDIPDRAPTVMFSTLRPGAHIPPHTGVTNLRAVVHLPLIVPEGCAFRVGSETREWREGVAWAFDDTIEHEAWNRSGETRVVLIVDAWNPLLVEAERAALRAVHAVLGPVGGVPVDPVG